MRNHILSLTVHRWFIFASCNRQFRSFRRIYTQMTSRSFFAHTRAWPSRIRTHSVYPMLKVTHSIVQGCVRACVLAYKGIKCKSVGILAGVLIPHKGNQQPEKQARSHFGLTQCWKNSQARKSNVFQVYRICLDQSLLEGVELNRSIACESEKKISLIVNGLSNANQ